MRGVCFICGSESDCIHREEGLYRDTQEIRTEPPVVHKIVFDRGPHHQARKAVRIALKGGLITKPPRCERCSRYEYLAAHHWDYSQPLAVTWLCRRCHGVVDKLVQSRTGEPVQIFASLDLQRIATLLRTEYEAFGDSQIPVRKRLGKFSASSTTTTNAVKRGFPIV